VQRSITGPDKDWLTLDEAAAYMGLSGSTLKRLIDSGKFPKGARVTGKILLWGWMDVVAFMHLASRSPGDDETADEETEPPKRTK